MLISGSVVLWVVGSELFNHLLTLRFKYSAVLVEAVFLLLYLLVKTLSRAEFLLPFR